jgi:hypothetical protein
VTIPRNHRTHKTTRIVQSIAISNLTRNLIQRLRRFVNECIPSTIHHEHFAVTRLFTCVHV